MLTPHNSVSWMAETLAVYTAHGPDHVPLLGGCAAEASYSRHEIAV